MKNLKEISKKIIMKIKEKEKRKIKKKKLKKICDESRN